MKAGSEDALQRDIMRFLDAVLPRDAMAFHVPNGGKRSKAQAGIFKALGVKAGVPDIIILRRGVARFIEVKGAKGALSPEQKSFRDWAIAHAFDWALCRSVEQAKATLEFWNIATREAK